MPANKNKKNENGKSNFEDLDETKFKEGDLRTELRVSKIKDSDISGIHINTGKIKTEKFTKRHKGVWIPSYLDVNSWLRKLKIALHKLFSKWYGKEIVSENDIILQEEKIDELQKQLFEEQKKREEMEKNLEDYKAKKELAKEVKTKKQEYGQILNKFEADIKKSVNENNNIEEDIKRDIKVNRWILGLDCEVRAKNKDIDKQAEIDLHIINSFGQNRIIEIKSPNKNPIKRKRAEGRFEITPELSEAISELLTYMHKTDFYSEIEMEGTYKINKPSGLIIIGFKLNKTHKKFLNQLNYHIKPHIQIITYDELIENAKKEVSLID
ncbi:MAG: Shedu anti-phage system protein SduA domain-containing protein [archaeon]